MNLKGENMSQILKDNLKDIYHTYKDHKNPPVPVNTIKKYLKLSGIPLEKD